MLTRLLLIAILVVAAGGSVQSQSLAEVAAKDKERRAKTGGSSKSFTDSDLRDAASKRAREGGLSSSGIPPASAPQARSSSAPGPLVAQEASGSTDSSLSESSKKSRGAEYKVRLAEAETYLKQAEEYLRAAQENWDFVNSHTNGSISLDPARSLLAAAKKEAERRRKLRDDIEDAARREGIPPGYLR